MRFVSPNRTNLFFCILLSAIFFKNIKILLGTAVVSWKITKFASNSKYYYYMNLVTLDRIAHLLDCPKSYLLVG